MSRNSRVPGFYKLSLDDRHRELALRSGLTAAELQPLRSGCLDLDAANHIVENVVGMYALPLGLGLNFQVNGKDYLVPMCVEEPSVVAAASNAARMIRAGGGFQAEADEPVMIAQVQLLEVPDTGTACAAILSHSAELIAACDAAQPSLVRRGGGTRGIEVRVLVPSVSAIAPVSASAARGMLVVHLLVDCRDAMGANLVNTVAEAVADRLAELAGGTVGLRILSNLADRRCVRVRCRVPADVLATEHHDGDTVRDGVVAASRFAELDPYRAATHNKGVLNGVDAVVIATGNDWRSVEAGAHAYAARDGVYRPLSIWRSGSSERGGESGGDLLGQIELPMAIGTVGGTLKVHPGARLALRILGTTKATELGMVIAAVGLASNLAALRALACEGIQRGHMSLHARSVALSAGATGPLVDRVAEELAACGEVRAERAVLILERLRAEVALHNGQHAKTHHHERLS